MAALPPPPLEKRLLTIFWIGVVAAYALLFLAFYDRVGVNDHDYFLASHHQQYWNVRLFGIAKQWTPLMCGGMSMAANPHFEFLSFSMILSYLLGPFAGMRVASVAWFAVGWLGAWLYAGLWVPSFTTRAVAASLFIGNGFFIGRFAAGHLNMLPFHALPLILYALHAVASPAQDVTAPRWHAGLTTLLLGGALALIVDGSPIVILHLLPWIAIYALALAFCVRSTRHLVVLGAATAIAVVLDLGYLWPMVDAAREFPRRRPDDFVNPLILLYFLLVPSTGMGFHTRYMGHEMSVWTGPVVVALIWISRRELWGALPRAMRIPWLATGAVAILLGMGSLGLIGVPRFLSPFDLLRDWPGFRSMGVTGRYWGFLALPLSMLGAQAMAWFAARREPRRAKLVVVAALAVQVAFQLGAIAPKLALSSRYHAPAMPDGFVARAHPDAPGEAIENVQAAGLSQSALITPTRGVIDCYDNGDYIRGSIVPGNDLVQAVMVDDAWIDHRGVVSGIFKTWSWVRLRLEHPLLRQARHSSGGTIRVVLNQAYNRHWSAGGGTTLMAVPGNLAVELRPSEAAGGIVDLRFDDPASRQGVFVSLLGWSCWLIAVPIAVILRRRHRITMVAESASQRTLKVFQKNGARFEVAIAATARLKAAAGQYHRRAIHRWCRRRDRLARLKPPLPPDQIPHEIPHEEREAGDGVSGAFDGLAMMAGRLLFEMEHSVARRAHRSEA